MCCLLSLALLRLCFLFSSLCFTFASFASFLLSFRSFLFPFAKFLFASILLYPLAPHQGGGGLILFSRPYHSVAPLHTTERWGGSIIFSITFALLLIPFCFQISKNVSNNLVDRTHCTSSRKSDITISEA